MADCVGTFLVYYNYFAQNRVFVCLSTHMSKLTFNTQKISLYVINKAIYE